MKRLITGLTAALALALVGTARADDTKTTESKSTVKQKDDGTGSVKVEKKSTNDPIGAAELHEGHQHLHARTSTRTPWVARPPRWRRRRRMTPRG